MPGKLVIKPTYDIPNKVPDATIGYSVQKTSLTCNVQAQKFSLSQVFGKNQIAPTISTKSKDVSLLYSRELPKGKISTTLAPGKYSVTYARGGLSTTLKPNESISVKYLDGEWDATITAPLDGYLPKEGSGIKLSMKRNVGVSLF